MSRAPASTRHVLTEEIRRQIDRFSETAPGKDAVEKRTAAIVAWAAMIGAMMLARISDSEDLSDELLEATAAFIDTRL